MTALPQMSHEEETDLPDLGEPAPEEAVLPADSAHAYQILTDRIEQLEFALGHLSESFSDNAVIIAGFEARLEEISAKLDTTIGAVERHAPPDQDEAKALSAEVAALKVTMVRDHKTLLEQIDVMATRPSSSTDSETLRQVIERNSADLRALADRVTCLTEQDGTTPGCPESEAAIARFILAFRHLAKRTEALDQTIRAHLGAPGSLEAVSDTADEQGLALENEPGDVELGSDEMEPSGGDACPFSSQVSEDEAEVAMAEPAGDLTDAAPEPEGMDLPGLPAEPDMAPETAPDMGSPEARSVDEPEASLPETDLDEVAEMPSQDDMAMPSFDTADGEDMPESEPSETLPVMDQPDESLAAEAPALDDMPAIPDASNAPEMDALPEMAAADDIAPSEGAGDAPTLMALDSDASLDEVVSAELPEPPLMEEPNDEATADLPGGSFEFAEGAPPTSFEAEQTDTGDLSAPTPDAPAPETDAARAAQPFADALIDLPGAGPGLTWMLGQAGIQSMTDLARADEAKLAGQLGMFGQLLDLGYWIRNAQEKIAS